MGAPVHMPMHPKHMDLIWEVGRIALTSDAPSGTLNVHQALASPRVSNHVGVTTVEDSKPASYGVRIYCISSHDKGKQ